MRVKERIIVVTGGNRGIGREICRQLASFEDTTVVLTCRQQEEGLEAVNEFAKEELSVRFHSLDVTNASQILQLSKFLESEFGRCDGLVNNAGIFLDDNEDTFLTTEISTLRQTMETNVYGPFMLCQALVPLMKKNNYGRIVNISSGLGQLSQMGSGYTAYRMSKVTINAITRILAAELLNTNILVNSMCPGWVKTRMGGENAPRSVQEGADTAVWLARLPDGGPTGKIFQDRQEVLW